MNLIFTLGWTLLHFLWQGTLIALLLAVALAALRSASARARYAAASIAMVFMMACAVVTFLRMNVAAPLPAPSVLAGVPPAVPPTNTELPAASSSTVSFSGFLPWLAYFWIAGVSLLSVRAFGGWMTLKRYCRRNSHPSEAAWQQRMMRLAQRLEISRAITLCESTLAEVPAVIGWIRPVVLLPACALSGLSPEQLEGILAHELAHIRRHDYLVNLFQTCIETLLFYHPAVWWVGSRMRVERENCCDDLAVQVCGDAVAYARALTQLEQLRCDMPRLAMAATRGPLLQRIQRLLPSRPSRQVRSAGWIGAAAVLLIVAAGWASPRLARSNSITAQNAPASRGQQASSADESSSSDQNAGDQTTNPQSGKAAKPSPQSPAGSSAAEQHGSSFVEEIAAAGYRNLSVDQLISLKIHDVSGQYIREIRARGYNPTVDELVALKIHDVTPEYMTQLKGRGFTLDINHLLAFRIHGVNPEALARMNALGYQLNADQAVAMHIHGLTPDFAGQIKNMGLGSPSFDQLLAMKIHGIDPQYASGMKETGVRGLNIDSLVALKIHGADPSRIKEFSDLGFQQLSVDQVLAACIHGVTPDFVREVRKHGLKDLTLEQIIKLKQFGILDRPASI